MAVKGLGFRGKMWKMKWTLGYPNFRVGGLGRYITTHKSYLKQEVTRTVG